MRKAALLFMLPLLVCFLLCSSVAFSGSEEEETALEGMTRLDEQLWNAILNRDTDMFISTLEAYNYTPEQAAGIISDSMGMAERLDRKYVYILAEKQDFCYGGAVHYRIAPVSGTGITDADDSGYLFSLRKTSGRWAITRPTADESAWLASQLDQYYDPGFSAAADSRRNCISEDTMMWTQKDGVMKGVLKTDVAYMYQTETGDVNVVLYIANGLDHPAEVPTVQFTLTDASLGQIFDSRGDCGLTVPAETVELYSFTVPADQVTPGRWTRLSISLHF